MNISLTDKLFKNAIDLNPTSIANTTENNLMLYSEGYKEAGNVLYEFYVKNKYFENWIIFPLVFNYRHYVELKLKELIFIGKSFLGEEKEFPNEHKILALWKEYRNKILSEIDSSICKDDLDKIEMIISEFDKKDSGSMKFRYPLNKNDFLTRSLDKPYFDLKNFKKIIDEVIIFFNEQSFIINNYQELKNQSLDNNHWE